jgi:uncharacterized damage-inducible protein DinB
MSQSTIIRNFIILDVKRRLFNEGIVRIKKCLDQLSEEQVWYKHNANVNSVGNLILHLCGNVTQYVLHGIDGQADVRVRATEFSEKGPIANAILVKNLDALEKNVDAALDRITADDLTQERQVQGFDENVTSILIHVTEHFSYHVGQITYYTKYILDVDTGYYAGLDLDVTG